MTLHKCPRCELNYIMDGEKICSVCRREVKGEPEQDDMIELCTECGEHPAVPGGELCQYCLKELARRSAVTPADDTIVPESASIELDNSVSSMDEIELDIGGDLDGEPFDGDEDAFKDDDDDDDDDDDEE